MTTGLGILYSVGDSFSMIGDTRRLTISTKLMYNDCDKCPATLRADHL